MNVFNPWYIERQIGLQYISGFLEIQRTWYLHEVWFLVVFGFNRSIISFLNNELWYPFGNSKYSWFTSSYSQTFLSLMFYLNIEFLVYWNQPIGDEYKKVFLSNFSIFSIGNSTLNINIFCKSVKVSRRLRPFLKSLLNEVPSSTLIASVSQVPQVFK